MRVNISNVTKTYGEIKALSGISAEIAEDVSILTLIGPSGGGKSTLLRILGGLEVPDEGGISINGRDVCFESKEDLLNHRRSNGFLFQSFNLFPHKSALENITLPLQTVHGLGRAEAIDKAEKSLKRFGLEAHSEKFPFELSGGQQQRVAIARAIAPGPSLLFLDEPTSALDPEMTGEVLDLIVELKNTGQDIILTTHEMGFARQVADRVAFLDSGEINIIGKPDELFDPKLYSVDTRLGKFLSRVTRY